MLLRHPDEGEKKEIYFEIFSLLLSIELSICIATATYVRVCQDCGESQPDNCHSQKKGPTASKFQSNNMASFKSFETYKKAQVSKILHTIKVEKIFQFSVDVFLHVLRRWWCSCQLGFCLPRLTKQFIGFLFIT